MIRLNEKKVALVLERSKAILLGVNGGVGGRM